MSLNLALDFYIAAEKYRNHTAIIHNGHEISYWELADSVRHWAFLFSKLGISRGDSVSLVMPNVPEFTIAYFAILHLGAVVVPCNTLFTSHELAYLISHSDSRFLITHPSCMISCLGAVREVDSNVGVIVTGSKEIGQKMLPEVYRDDAILWLEEELVRLKETFPFSVTPLTVSEPFASSQNIQNVMEIPDENSRKSSEEVLRTTVRSLDYTGGASDEYISVVWPEAVHQTAYNTVSFPVLQESNAENLVVSPEIAGKTIIDARRTSVHVSTVSGSFNSTAWNMILESVPSAGGQLHTSWSPALVPTNPDDTAVILYTSGTTGFPKGAQLAHFNLYSNAQFVRESMTGYKPGKRTLAMLPLYHSFGQTVVQNAALFSGATIVMVSRFDPRRVLQTIVDQKVEIAAGVPTMLIHLANIQQKLGLDVSGVKQIISGGSPLSAASSEEIRNTFKNCTVLEGYGLSETSPLAVALTPSMEPHPGSIGKEISGVQVRIMRSDHTFAVPGEVGELVIRGHNVMKSYHKNPLATEKAFFQTWFLSGDLGYCDEEGFFYVVDRKKDIIIRAGMNIYPREIEEVLNAHPSVQMAAVVGIPHSVHGEDVIGFVVLNQNVPEVDELCLCKYCRTRLAAYKCPQKIVILPSLPQGPTGKILKLQLKEQFLSNSSN